MQNGLEGELPLQTPYRAGQGMLSPLSGAYLLIVVGEPHSPEHSELIFSKITKGFLSWDVENSHVDIEKELLVIANQAPEGEEAKNGERLIQFATENLVTEVLIHPQVNTLLQCVKNLLSSFTRHRHLIHAGYTFAGNGSWMLQDGTFSIADFTELFHEIEVQRVMRAYENCITIHVHCSPEGDWNTSFLKKEPFSKLCKLVVNPDDHMSTSPGIGSFVNYLSQFLQPISLQQVLEPSEVVGNIRFSHPTLYVFPGGQGDSALFGINGFNMLVDGGYSRKSCFWDFTRHLDRLDAVLITRLNNQNTNGIASVLKRKAMSQVYPHIGHIFCNIMDRKNSPDGDKDRDALLVNIVEEGNQMVENLRHLNLKPHLCFRENTMESINLYHKVGHGKLDMYVLNPSKDSKEVKEFITKWNTDTQSFGAADTSFRIDGKVVSIPICNLVSISALLVWQPANPNNTITRILFPGSAPQHKIFDGLEKLKHLDFLKYPVCSAKSLSASSQKTKPKPTEKFFTDMKATKPPVIHEMKPAKQPPAPPPPPTKVAPNKPKTEKAPVKAEPKPKIETKEIKKEDEKIKEMVTEKKLESSPDKTKVEAKPKPESKPKPKVESRIDSRPPKSAEKKASKGGEKKQEGKKPSPPTPKKVEPKAGEEVPAPTYICVCSAVGYHCYYCMYNGEKEQQKLG